MEYSASLQSRHRTGFILTSIAILIGFTLTFISWSGTCTEACAESHHYRLYGMHFESIGFIFFTLLTISHFLSYRIPACRTFTSILLASGLGAETSFIIAQKFMVKAWCPICLSIAASLLIAALPSMYTFYQSLFEKTTRGNRMKYLQKGTTILFVGLLGFLFSFFGIAKINPLEGVENEIQKKLAFGKTNSPIEVYVFTSWTCPACKKLEPALERILPSVFSQAKVIFVEPEADLTALNFVPYNVSFMIYEKSKYLELRHVLEDVSKETSAPTDADIQKATGVIGVTYKELSFADIVVAVKYFNDLTRLYEITHIPALVIVNRTTGNKQSLYGSAEVTQENVSKVIRQLQGSHPASDSID